MLNGPLASAVFNVDLIYWLLFILIGMIIFESFMIHMHRMEALSKKPFDMIQYIRRSISVVMQGVTFVSIYYIASHSNNPTLKFLASNSCTFDESINGSFIQIQDYMLQNASRSYAIFALFSVILITDLVGIVHKVQYDSSLKKDKYSKVSSGKDDVEMKEPIQGTTI